MRDEDVLEQTPLSVVSGRSLEEIAEGRGGKRVWQSNRSGGPGKVAKMSARKIGQPARRNASAAKPHGAKRAPRAAAALAGKKSIKRRKSAKAKPAGAPLVIEANFRDWTADRLVRQAAFKGLREDKPAQEVARETSAMAARTSIAKKTSKHAAPARRGAPTSGAGAGTGNGHPGADEVRLTHPDRVYWVDVGVTKQDLADYYGAVWDRMAPHVIGRPLALVRCPEGTKGQCFFQKHASAGLSEKTLRTVIDGKGRQVIGIDDLDGLLSLVQVGVLEIHVRGSRLDRLEVCDRIVLDLDPGEGVDWSDMAAAARDVRERLAALELEGFVKLSGGKGLHVVLPVEGTDWDSAKSFAQAIALAMAADDPDRYVAKISKSLRKGKIFVDYLRNSLEQTSVAAYSSRARSGAPVSVPVAWQELGRTTSAHQYTVLDVMRRLSGLKQDPWQDIGRIRQKLPDTKPARG